MSEVWKKLKQKWSYRIMKITMSSKISSEFQWTDDEIIGSHTKLKS